MVELQKAHAKTVPISENMLTAKSIDGRTIQLSLV